MYPNFKYATSRLRIYSIYWKHIKTSNSNNNSNKQQVDAATWSCKDVFTDFRSHKVNAAECAKRQDRVLIGNRWGCRRSCCRCCCCSWASMRLLKLLLLLLWRRLLSSVMTRPLHLSVCPASSVCVSLKSEATKRALCAVVPRQFPLVAPAVSYVVDKTTSTATETSTATTSEADSEMKMQWKWNEVAL